MADLDVFVITAARTPKRKRPEVLTPSVLPQARVPTSRVVRSVCDGADRLSPIQRLVGPVLGAVSVSGRNRKTAHRATAAGPSLGNQDVVLFGRTRARAELRVCGFPSTGRAYSHGNPEQALI